MRRPSGFCRPATGPRVASETDDFALDLSAPFDQCRETIVGDWVDLNQHMNVAYYMVVFDRATEAFLRQLGAGRDYTRSGEGTVFALEAVVKYERELRLYDTVRITTRLVARTGKRTCCTPCITQHRRSGRRRWNSCCFTSIRYAGGARHRRPPSRVGWSAFSALTGR